MGYGITSTIKDLAPLVIYIIAIFFVLGALAGKRQEALWFFIFILPLKNVVAQLHIFPFGKDIDEVFLLVLLLGILMKGASTKEKMLSRSPINPIACLLIFYTFISLLQGSIYLNEYKLFDLSDFRIQAWKNFCVLPLLFFVTFNTIRDKKGVWRTVLVICLTIAFMDMYLVRQLHWFSSFASREKVSGTFEYLGPNEIAAFYAQYTVLFVCLFFYMRKSLGKFALFALICTNLYCVLFLFSRAAYLSTFAGLFILFAFKKRVLLIPLIAMAIYWQVALPEPVQERIRMTTNEYGELDNSSEMRIVMWKESLNLFSESPILGVGWGVIQRMGFGLGDMHNIYLETLVEQGLVGIIIFLLLLFILFIQGIKLFSGGDDNLSKGLGLGFLICIIVLMINNVFGDRWTYPEVGAYFWVFAGLVARLNAISEDANREKLILERKSSAKRVNGKF